MDVAMRVAIPEFDGRVISVPFSFNEVVDEGDTLGTPVNAYRSAPDRVSRIAGLATRLARLRRIPPDQRRVAIVLSAYPTRRSRIGNAVALDTPASVVALLHALEAAGYAVERIPSDGDRLMSELIDAFSYERDAMTPRQLAQAPGRWSEASYCKWWQGVDSIARQAVEEAWGEAPGSVYCDPETGDLVFAGLDLGGVLVTVQPPRGFGANPVAVYHSPDLAPTHHYLAFYRWLDEGWGADAIVHAGKHGTLEWLPGKGVGLSADCFPDLALGDLPLIYPFVVNDPGEGTQAKRRAHATIVDHLVPPMTRAETYDDIARLEQLLDEHAQVAALDPAKLPAIRKKVWDLLVSAELHRDMGVGHAPEGDAFDELVNHVDGYLCELKDAQIRGGLHILGEVPEGEGRLDLLLALTRLPQAGVPSLRQVVAERLGVTVGEGSSLAAVDSVEAECRALLSGAVEPSSPGEEGRRGVGRWHRRTGPRRHHTRDRPRAVGPRRTLGPPRSERGADAGHGPRAPDRAQFLFGRSEGSAITTRLGGGSGARRATSGPVPRGRRSIPRKRRPRRLGHSRHADRGRRRGRGPGPDGSPTRVAGRVGAGHRRRADPLRGPGAPPRRCRGPCVRLRPRRLSTPDRRAGRRGRTGRLGKRR